MRLQLASRALLAILFIAVTAGAVSADEARIRDLFRLADTNGDGRISRDEFDTNKVAIIFRNAKNTGAELKFEDTYLTREAFDSIDTGRKGVITARDIVFAPVYWFEGFDTNNDGFIDFEEFATVLRRIER